MEVFGSFETSRELSSGQGARVYRARQTGVSAADDFVVKVFSLEPLIGPDQETRSDLDPLLADLSQAFTRRVELQRQAAAGSSRIAPILETGQDERGVWYATRFYPRSVQRIIAGRVALGREALFHIVNSVVGGALEIRQACGRGHGNLKPANVLIGPAARLREAEIALTDLLPGGGDEAARYELADLRAIGEIIYQLVRRREIADSAEWLILPIEASKEWSGLFGKEAERWRGLCNRLLDPNLSTETYSLEKLASELATLEPKPPVSRRALALAGAIVVLLAAAGWLIVPRLNRAEVRITSDPPGASLLVNGQPKGKTPLHDRWPKGSYKLVAQYGELEEQQATLVIASRQSQSTNLEFEYGMVKITSEPSGARVQAGGVELGKTPLTNYLKPGRVVEFRFDLAGHETTILSNVVKSGKEPTLLPAKLAEPRPGDVEVEFDSNLRLGEGVTLNGGPFSNAVLQLPWKKPLPPGRYTLTAAYRNWPPVARSIAVSKGDSPASVRFEFPYGSVVLKSDPPGAKVWVGTNLVGVTDTEIMWQPGRANFRFEKPDYESTNSSIDVADNPEKERARVEVTLVPSLGFVDLTSDPPGAGIYDAGNLLTNTIPGRPARMGLRPKVYALTARYGDLREVPQAVTVEKGITKPVHFAFDYGKVELSSDPPGAEVEDLDRPKQEWVSLDKISILRVGTHRLEARLAGLVDVPDEVVVRMGKTSQHAFKFDYGTVMITSIPPGAVVFLDNGIQIGQTPYRTNLPFGPVSYSLVWSNEKPRTRSATISALTNYYLLSADFTQSDTWPNSIGMKFAHISKASGNPDGEYWVGVYEVTQQEYERVMGADRNHSKARGDRLPVQNVSWNDAMEFCAKLKPEQDKLPEGMTHYTLPTETQCGYFVGDASSDDAVMSKPIQRDKPEKVGTKKANNFGLYDVLGNVWEMCVGVQGSAKRVYGGCFESQLRKKGAVPLDDPTGDMCTGFRVVLVPGPK